MDDFTNKKIIIFDVDNTLTESKTPVDSEMKSLLEQLLNVKKVAIISGGSMGQIGRQIWNFLDCVSLSNLYILPQNGSSLYSYEHEKAEWKIVYDEPLNDEEKKKIRDAYDVAISMLNIPKPEKVYGGVVDDRGSQITFSELGQDAPLEEKKKWDPDQQKRVLIVQHMQPMLENFSIAIGGLTSIDVTTKNTNKAYGAGKLMEYLRLQKSEALYIGDALFPGGNDYSMKEAGFDCIKVADPGETKKVIGDILLE